MINEVIARLESLGYVYVVEDKPAIEFCLQLVEGHIKNSCNLVCVPEDLKFVAVDMTCGEFLKVMREAGKLEDFEFSSAVKTIKEGDTSITYMDAENDCDLLDRLIDYLIKSREGELVSFRVLKW